MLFFSQEEKEYTGANTVFSRQPFHKWKVIHVNKFKWKNCAKKRGRHKGKCPPPPRLENKTYGFWNVLKLTKCSTLRQSSRGRVLYVRHQDAQQHSNNIINLDKLSSTWWTLSADKHCTRRCYQSVKLRLRCAHWLKTEAHSMERSLNWFY